MCEGKGVLPHSQEAKDSELERVDHIETTLFLVV
jgi:hypothetical protein